MPAVRAPARRKSHQAAALPPPATAEPRVAAARRTSPPPAPAAAPPPAAGRPAGPPAAEPAPPTPKQRLGAILYQLQLPVALAAACGVTAGHGPAAFRLVLDEALAAAEFPGDPAERVLLEQLAAAHAHHAALLGRSGQAEGAAAEVFRSAADRQVGHVRDLALALEQYRTSKWRRLRG